MGWEWTRDASLETLVHSCDVPLAVGVCSRSLLFSPSVVDGWDVLSLSVAWNKKYARSRAAWWESESKSRVLSAVLLSFTLSGEVCPKGGGVYFYIIGTLHSAVYMGLSRVFFSSPLIIDRGHEICFREK
jgi:hypothetical protein